MTPTIGLFSFALAVLCPLLYLLARQLRKGIAYANGTDGPKERPKIYCVIWAIMGFILGSLYQPLHERGEECIAASQPLVQCVVFPSR
ncbi:hypothetical protein E4T63_12835 [Pseudomonas fluorescens]|uniref:Uncharacterized protein n=1 Tax=Pseudomonas fluorescens TaxID=294 RepID=A0AAP8Z164_PSEFL|nr:hypothetical protein E4T63_12835 [Pseudomonas fluorescens]